jgi:broad specificity phosphatase PhoE
MTLLARHGETDDNREPIRIQGFRDPPLNETGREQARDLAGRVADLSIAALFSSDLQRAHETATIVGERIGLRPVPDPRLREGNRGDWEGRYWFEIERDDPRAFAAWRRAGADFRFPGGESLGEQLERVLAALSDIREAAPGRALVITHGGAIRAALCHARGVGLERFHSFSVPNVALIDLCSERPSRDAEAAL